MASHLRHRLPTGTAALAEHTPAPATGGTPTPMRLSAGCPPREGPAWSPAGSLPGRGGSREGKNQKQIVGVNGAEPRAASAAAV